MTAPATARRGGIIHTHCRVTYRPYQWREHRLSRGWEPDEFIAHLRAEAARHGITLPHTWQLLHAVFLWENHREPIPVYWDGLIHRVFDIHAENPAV